MDQQDIQNFKKLCRKYNDQKKWIKQMSGMYRLADGVAESTVSYAETGHTAYALLVKNTRYVDTVMLKIEKAYGKEAGQILREMYIDGEKADRICQKYNIKRRTLYRYYSKWIEKGLEEAENDSQNRTNQGRML